MIFFLSFLIYFSIKIFDFLKYQYFCHFEIYYLFENNAKLIFYKSGTITNDKQLKNIPFILVTLKVFHLDNLGNDTNDIQLENIVLILKTLLVFHLDISGKDVNNEQFENIPFI